MEKWVALLREKGVYPWRMQRQLYPKRQGCPRCGGFGFMKREKENCNNEGQRD
jgi:hypothetical protein